jgi:surface polysaccharide O-acyltransferase-like enzyme
VSKRLSNFELLRIVSMVMVLICHANGYINEGDLVGAHGVTRLMINQFTLVCVNVFVMISGWFGINASLKGACKLLFQVLYITLLCIGICLVAGWPVSFRNDVLPNLLFGTGYWFVVCFLFLYALARVLQRFIEQAGQKEYRNVLIAWLSVEFIYGFLLDTGYFNFGFSPLSFVGLYLLARYARLYPGKLFSLSKSADFAIYVSLSILSAILFWLGYKWFGMGFHLNHYDSPFAILAALYFLLAFSKMDFECRSINWMASSAFAIYLIHENALISPWYRQFFKDLDLRLPSVAAYPVAFLFILAIGFACILADKPREWIWNRIVKHQ